MIIVAQLEADLQLHKSISAKGQAGTEKIDRVCQCFSCIRFMVISRVQELLNVFPTTVDCCEKSKGTHEYDFQMGELISYLGRTA